MPKSKSSKEKIVDGLNDQAWKARIFDSIAANKFADDALQLAEEIGYKKGEADAHRTKGFCLIRLAKHKEAIQCFDIAKKIYEDLGDRKGLAPVYEYYGIIYRTWGEFQSALEHINRAIELSQETGFAENEMTNHYQLGVTYRSIGDYGQALESLDKSLTLAKDLDHELMKGYVLNVMGSIYFKTENYHKALQYYQEGLDLRQSSGDKWGEAGSLDNVGMTLLRLGQLDKARESCHQSLSINKEVGDKKGEGNSLYLLAQIHEQLGDPEKAAIMAEQCRQLRVELNDKKGQAETLILLAKSRSPDDKSDSLKYLDDAFRIVYEIGAKDLMSEIFNTNYEIYKNRNHFDKALEYLEKYIDNEKSLHKDAVDEKIRNLEISHKVEESKKEAEIFKLRNVELTELLNKLKATQAQLIQSEKMASLGELTAGIAHEIKNPLNFVNNFADINGELIDEMIEAIEQKDYEEVIDLAKDVRTNAEKVRHHGRRADSIVKGMLMHSRTSTGEKELTDINSLCDEYLRLAFHGLRAKDKTFNSAFETRFDESVPKIKIVPQEIGRVILNILNNGFYAIDQRRRKEGPDFKPLLSIETTISPFEGEPRGVTITITDNGGGIPTDIVDKIFQPFFTTKPTGSGTGLGLSLSYDIVTKGHGGNLKVETK